MTHAILSTLLSKRYSLLLACGCVCDLLIISTIIAITGTLLVCIIIASSPWGSSILVIGV